MRQRIKQYFIAPEDINLTWPIFWIILITTLIVAVNDSVSRFPIVSDSYMEYTTFLAYANLDSYWWRPLTDNILSTCIWTTYIPAYIYKLFMFNNPEMFYRVFTGVATAPAPALIYLLFRKYTPNRIAIPLMMIFFSGFYYIHFAEYARMTVAISWGFLLLYAVDSRHKYRYWYIVIASFGLLTSHYTTALIYIGVVGIASVIMLTRRYMNKEMALSIGSLVSVATLYYGLIAKRTMVLKYAVQTANKALNSAGLGMPDFVSKAVSISSNTELDISYYNIHKQYMPVIVNPYPAAVAAGPSTDGMGPINDTGININPMKGERLDFAIAEGVILFRFIITAIISISLIKNKDTRRNPIPYLALSASTIAALSTWMPAVAQSIGVPRVGWLSLPFELLAIALWHNKNKNKDWLTFPLSAFILIYH